MSKVQELEAWRQQHLNENGSCICCHAVVPYSRLKTKAVATRVVGDADYLCSICDIAVCWQQFGQASTEQRRCGRVYHRRTGSWLKVPRPGAQEG